MGRPLDEGELIGRARAGDGAAFARLVEAHGEVAFRTALLILQDAAEAEDAVQEGLIKAHRALGRFRTGEPFRPWLLAITANEARNRRRARKRRDDLARREAMLTSRRPQDTAPGPEAALLETERRERLVAALGRLSEPDRLVISLRHLLDLSEQETAAALGCRRGTVKSRLSRALGRLRADLGEAR